MNAKVLAAADARNGGDSTSANGSTNNTDQRTVPSASTSNGTNAPSSSGPSTLATASREELVEVLQKMNKKVKLLTNIRTQLTEQAQNAEKDRDRLKEIVHTHILKMDGSSSASPATASSTAEELLALWIQKEQQHRDQIQGLKSQLQSLQASSFSSSSGNTTTMENGDPINANAAAAALRQQLQQEHQQAMAAVKEEYAREREQWKEELLRSKTALDATSVTATGSSPSSPEAIETLQKSHEEAMEKLKKAAALQMQNFKKKVAAARTAELEKVVKDTREQVTAELKTAFAQTMSSSSTITEEDMNELRQELESKHVAELEDVKAKMASQMATNTELQVNKLLMTMNNQAKEHEDELQRERQAFQQQLEEAQLKIQSLNESGVNSASQLDSLRNQLTALLSTSQKEKEELIASHQRELERTMAEIRAEWQKTHEEELKSIKTQSESGQGDAIKALKAKFAEQAKAFQQRATADKQQAIENATIEVRASIHGMLQAKEDEYQKKTEEIVNQHNLALSQLQKEMMETKSTAEDLSNKLVSTEDRLKQMESDHEIHVRDLNEQVRLSQASGEEALTREIQNQKDQMQTQFTSLQHEKDTLEQTIMTMKKDHEEAMAELSQSLQSSTAASSVSESRITELEMVVSQANSDLANAKAKFEEELSTTQSHLSEMTTQKQEVEVKLKASDDSAAELQKKGSEMAASIEALEVKYAAEKAKLIDDMQQDLNSRLSAAEDRLKQREADHESHVRDLNEQVRLSQTSGEEAFTREIQNQRDQMQTRLCSLQVEKETLEQTIMTMKKDHEGAMAQLTQSLQSSVAASSASEGRIAELEMVVSQTNSDLANAKAKFEEDLAETQSHLSDVTSQKQELELKLKASDECASEFQKKGMEMAASMEALEVKYAAEKAKIIDEMQLDLSTKLAAAEDRIKQIEANHESQVRDFNEQVRLSQTSGEEAFTREIQSQKEQMQAQFASLQVEKEALEQTIVTMKKDHEGAMAQLTQSVQSSTTASSVSEGRIAELEMIVSQTNSDLANAKAKFDEDLAAAQSQLSDMTSQKQELELKLKASDEGAAELQKTGSEITASMEALETKHAAEIAQLREQVKEDTTRDMEEKMREAAQLDRKKHSDEIQDLRGKMADHVDKMNAHFSEKLNAEREKITLEKDELEKKYKKREEQVAKLANQLKEVGEAAKKEREEKANLQKAVKAEMGKCQKLEEELTTQKKLLEDNKKASAASTTKERDALKEATMKFEAERKSLQEARNSSANKVEELTGKLEALTMNLNSMAEDIKKKDEALVSAEKQKIRLVSSEKEVSELRQQITNLKLEVTKNTQIANRLQGEKEASERNHGQRTALMGMMEDQLAEINEKNSEANAKLEAALYDLSQRDEVVQSLEDKLKEAEAALTAAEKKKKETIESLAQAQKGAGKKSSMMVESLQKELQQLQQSSARKSSAAQKLIQEREVECASLRATNKALQQEVDKGSLSDRKIFELAELQSNRESAQQIEIEVRDNAIERLKKALLDRDWDLASAENTVQEVEAQVEELGRVKRREDVNMDYLKSIVVQYLSKPPGTSERAALLPVLATLLQFDANDYRLIEDGKKSLTWFGGVEPKIIGEGAISSSSSTVLFTNALADFTSYLGGSTTTTASTPTMTATTAATSSSSLGPPSARMGGGASAEISISTPVVKPTNGSGRTTSLQF